MNNQQSLSQQSFSSQPPELALSGLGDLLRKAWEIYKARFWIFFGIVAISGLLGFCLGFFFKFLGFLPIILRLILLIPLIPLSILVGFWPQIALLYVIKERERAIDIKEAFKKAWSKIIPYCWIFFLDMLVIFGGLMLLVVPGLIFTFWFIFAEYVLISEDKKGMNALFRSKQLVSGHWWSVFGKLFVALLILIILVLPISFLTEKFNIPLIGNIIILLTAPLFPIFAFLLYEDLGRVKTGIPFEPPSTGRKLAFLLPGIIGGLLIPVMIGWFFYILFLLFK